MAVNYARHVSTKQTPQTEAIPGSVANDAGGFSFAVDCWTRLERFLILGNDGGSYYASERKLTQENAKAVNECADTDAARTVATIVAISEGGRAPKNDPAVFALALLANHPKAKGLALDVLQRVCRIPTHLFAFASMVQELRGWGRGLRKAVGKWYTEKAPRDLAYQCSKYQGRDGWTHRDLLRLSHPKAIGTTQDVLHWAVKGWEGVGDQPHDNADMLPIWAMEKAKHATTEAEIVRLIRDYRLVRECVPTQFLTSAAVWDALLADMPLTALVRNLATMTRIGLLAPLSSAAAVVCSRLADADRIHKAKVHPISLLIALRTYAAGHGERGSNTWVPVPQIVDALDSAFYLAYANVEPTGKRWLLGLDVSGSMDGTMAVGCPFLSAVEAEAAVALVTAATEKQSLALAFDTVVKGLPISPRQRLDDVTNAVSRLVHGGTDCAAPIEYALANRIPVDAFAIFTDSQTWAGKMHPVQAIQKYRQTMGIPAKMVVVALAANEFSVGAESDSGMLNVAGFDANVPTVMADFAR